jgi:hypothetical protein
VKNLKLLKWFFAWFVAMVVLAIFTLPDERPDKLDTISFSNTESAELYFLNVRAFYYNTSEEADGILKVYRLKSIFEDSLPSLPFALYNNWRTNETFIRLDTAYFDRAKYSVVIADSASIKTDTIPFPQGSNESQYVFAREVYRAIREKEKLGFISESGEEWIPESQLNSVKRTLADYFRLLDKL